MHFKLHHKWQSVYSHYLPFTHKCVSEYLVLKNNQNITLGCSQNIKPMSLGISDEFKVKLSDSYKIFEKLFYLNIYEE